MADEAGKAVCEGRQAGWGGWPGGGWPGGEAGRVGCRAGWGGGPGGLAVRVVGRGWFF